MRLAIAACFTLVYCLEHSSALLKEAIYFSENPGSFRTAKRYKPEDFILCSFEHKILILLSGIKSNIF
jgi:hypothetical protein